MRYRFLIVSIVLFLCCISHSYALKGYQKIDSLIKIVGVISDLEEGKAVVAQVYYERLPYFDDIGISTSKNPNWPFNGIGILNGFASFKINPKVLF